MAKQKISWVIPVYNESENITRLYKELNSLREHFKNDFTSEFVFVEDGSKDNSLELLTLIYEKDKDVKVVSFSRNFGHQMAITAGLDAATGDAIIFMDADLQDPPSVCYELVTEWQNGNDVVYAKRRSRKDSFTKKITAYWFYRILRQFAEIDIPEDTGDFRLISKQVADTLRSFPERHRFIRGLISYIGFKQKAVLFDRNDRTAGQSGYTIKKMMRLAEDAFTGFSMAPIMMVGVAGSILALVGIISAIISLIGQSLTGAAMGYATVLVGVVLLSLATIGQYIGRTFQQVQGRPLYIVKTRLTH